MDFKELTIFDPVSVGRDSVVVNFDWDEYFYAKQLQERIITFDEDIRDATASVVTQIITYINKVDRGIPAEERDPIKIFFTSPGGDVFAGFSLIDVIENSITPITIINTSYQYSMGAYIGMVGHKRYATPHATFLIHDGTTIIGDSSGKAHDFLKFDEKIQERMRDIVLKHTKIDEELLDKKSREEWYFFADEAKKYGLIDGIIGDDVTFEEII